MHDAHGDEPLEVRSRPPRQLSGLRGFFERHEVGVNDRLVLEFAADESVVLRIEAAARTAPPQQAPASGGAQPSAEESPPAAPAAMAAPPATDEVVDRFGRVTVRRLGAGRGSPAGPPPSEPAQLPDPPTERAPEPAGPAPDAGEAAPRAADARADARRARLNESGDLRTQVVRYLIRPETPVIVRVEDLAQRFSLSPSIAREVLEGIRHDPPPTLAVEAVRDDTYRISRVTVEQEA